MLFLDFVPVTVQAAHYRHKRVSGQALARITGILSFDNGQTDISWNLQAPFYHFQVHEPGLLTICYHLALAV